MGAARETASPYIGIALDHGRSFDSWLRRWKLDAVDRARIKRSLVDVYLDLQVSGLIVGFDLADDIERIVQLASAGHQEVWIGMPDDAFTRSSCDHKSLGGVVGEAADWGATGIKIGVHALDQDWDAAVALTYKWADVIASRGMELIVEPLFDHEDAALRSKSLASFKACPTIQYAKLDVHNPSSWSALYGKSFTPWLARSEGLEFDAYLSNLEQSVTFGCRGTMVGGAAWGISGLPILGRRFVTELVRRVDTLSLLWADPVEQNAGEGVGICRTC